MSLMSGRARIARAIPLALLLAACADAPTDPSAAPRGPRVTPPSLALGNATYQAQDLGTLRADLWSAAYDINDHGVVVGSAAWTSTLPQERHAIRWTKTFGLEDLGTGAGHNDATATSLNNNGWITGISFSHSGGGAKIITWSPPGWSETFGYGSGQAVGADNASYGQHTTGGATYGFRKLPGGPIELLPLPPGVDYARVYGVNDLGVAVGVAGLGDQRAVRWTSAGVTVLPTLAAGQEAVAHGINNHGVIVGFVRVPGMGSRAVRWLPNGTIEDLGMLPGGYTATAYGINDAGEIVGQSHSSQGSRAFRWTEGTGMQALPDLHDVAYDPNDATTWKYSVAMAINAHGDIAGSSRTASGMSHATVWRQVLNQPPVANPGGPYTAPEGSLVTFDAGGSTDPNGDALTYEWSYMDDSPLVYGRTVSRKYANNGTYMVTLRVLDGYGEVSESIFPVTITNVAPTIKSIVLDVAILNRPKVGQAFPLTVRWTDPGSVDAPWAWTIEWGDGTSSTGTKGLAGYDIAASHPYATAGTKSVRITIRDKDGGVATRIIPVSVQP